MDQKHITKDGIFRAMREMLIEAPPSEIAALAEENGSSLNSWAEVSKRATKKALARSKQGTAENIVPMHKGLSSFLVMLRRRDGIDEEELARKANVEEAEIRRIEFDPAYDPSPRTVFNLERAFSLPAGVLAKLTGAIKHSSPEIEQRAVQFAANAKSIGKLSKDERQLLSEFVKFLTEQK